MGYLPVMPGATYTAPSQATALGGLKPNQFSTVGGNIASQQQVNTLYDLNPFAIMQEVKKRHSTFVTDFRLLLKMFGLSLPTDANIYGHYEEDRLTNLLHINAIITPTSGAGTDVVLELGADSMFDAGQEASGSAVQASEIRVNDIILFRNGHKGFVVSKNTSVTPHRITVRPTLAAVSLTSGSATTDITAGSSYFIVTNAFGEGSGLPTGKIRRITKYTNNLTIVKESGGVTGSGATNKLFVNFQNTEDGSIFGVINRDMMASFERQCANTLLFGGTIDNVVELNSTLGIDIPVYGTEGLIDSVDAYGHTEEYTPGSYSLANFDAMSKTMTFEVAGTRALFTFDGFDIFAETENLFIDTLGNDTSILLMKEMAAQFDAPEEDWQPFTEKDFDFYAGFKSVHKSGFTYMFKQCNEFNDAVGAGSSVYDFVNRRIVAPFGTYKDPKEPNKPGFMFGYRYKQMEGRSRETVIDTFGGIGAAHFFGRPAVNGLDYVQNGMLGEIGFQLACPNLTYQQVAA